MSKTDKEELNPDVRNFSERDVRNFSERDVRALRRSQREAMHANIQELLEYRLLNQPQDEHAYLHFLASNSRTEVDRTIAGWIFSGYHGPRAGIIAAMEGSSPLGLPPHILAHPGLALPHPSGGWIPGTPFQPRRP